MKNLAVMLCLTLCVAACDSKPPEESKPDDKTVKVPTKKEVDDEVKKGVKDVISNKGPKWKISYSGDLSGNVEGGILTSVSVGGNITTAGGAMTPDKKAKAPQKFTMQISNADKDPKGMMQLTLPDGTKCSPDGELAPVKLIDKERKTFHAEANGKLKCGDKKVEFKATLKK